MSLFLQRILHVAAGVGLGLFGTAALAQVPTTQPIDLTHPTLFAVGYAHLDTQWRWTYPQVIGEFIANTMHDNFPLFEKYPDYIFNFTGSRRYQFMKEYFPDDFEKVRAYVKAGRWFPAGSSVDENDTNSPSAESIIRQTLYGNGFFRKEFGIASDEYMLPDSFGFNGALPTIFHHSGLKGFSTQKLSWGSAVGIPFPIGTWEGPDGSSIVAAFNPLGYTTKVRADLSNSKTWLARIEHTGEISGVFADYGYYGSGDRGGAPDAQSVSWIEKSIHGTGPVKVVSATASQMFDDITPEQAAKLPHYKGELELTQHSAGSITSQAFEKRLNRKNEYLADAAERASVAASWLGAVSYPTERLARSWELVLGSQMHDMMAGTAMPKAYEYCWNDGFIAANNFAAVVQDGVGAVATGLDTRGTGVSIVVYNPLATDREDVAEATISYPGPESVPTFVRVLGPDGKTAPSQVVGRDGSNLHVLFLARVPSVGFTVYDVQPAGAEAGGGELSVYDQTLENARFRVTINSNGDIASILDKTNNRQILQSPARLAMQYENPSIYPAWNMDWADQQLPPRNFVQAPATIKVVESGPVRVAIEITRESMQSKFVQTVRLSAGAAGNAVEVSNKIDWQTPATALKASFPLAVSNPSATYDIQVGVMERGNNDPKKYEVTQHEWFDLTNNAGDYGVAVLNDCKYGSDKPDDNTMRLTLLYTPGTRGGYQDQASQDFGRHEMLYAIAPHTGDWRAADVTHQAQRLNQPVMTFQTSQHDGPLGKSFQLLSVSAPQVVVEAIKKAEDSDDVIIRLRETTGRPAEDVQITAAGAVLSAREVNGQEQPINPAIVKDGKLITDISGYSLRAFALKLQPHATSVQPAQNQTVQLAFDADVVSSIKNPTDGSFDGEGRTYPTEQFPKSLQVDGIEFQMSGTADGEKNAVTCRGQTILLPVGLKNARVYLLAAADGDQPVNFTLGDQPARCTVQDWGGYLGQWDNRSWKGAVPGLTYDWQNAWDGLAPGFTKPAELAWYCSHRHHPSVGNEIYQYCYLYKYGFDVPDNATTLTLPNNPKVRVFAVTVSSSAHDTAVAARPLYDTLSDRHSTAPAIFAASTPADDKFDDATAVRIEHPLYWQEGGLHYTLDGSDPDSSSPVYSNPLNLSDSATIKAAEVSATGVRSPIAEIKFNIHDVTPPHILSATVLAGLPNAVVVLSEPVDPAAAQEPGHYRFAPHLEVTQAKLLEDGRTVILSLAAPVNEGAVEMLSAEGIADLSPAKNLIDPEPAAVGIVAPIFSVADALAASATRPAANLQVSSLPTAGTHPWTINLFCRMNKQPENQTAIAGFGRIDNTHDGTGRYLCKNRGGLQFFSSVDEVSSSAELDVGQWQMLTAVYDGQVLHLYKNAAVAAETPLTLQDDEAVVRIAPLDPWKSTRVFNGEIRNITIWNQSLQTPVIQAMWQTWQAPVASSQK